jgi:predicted lactoylglutathione lyase
MPAVPARASIVTLGVTDVARATAFYSSLGWRLSSMSQKSISFFDVAGSVLAVYERSALAADASVPADGTGFRAVTLAICCDSPDAVDDAAAEWVARGGSLVKQPHKAFWGGYSGYVADLDGHLWEIAHNPHAGFTPDGRLELP